MSEIVEVRVPEIGDFDAVDVAEVLVGPGDRVEPEDGLIVLESDKASMEVPSPQAGVVREVKVKVGDKVGQDAVIAILEPAVPAPAPSEPPPAPSEKTAGEAPEASRAAEVTEGGEEIRAEVVVLGSGPGGYTAAFRAADLGKDVVLVERYAALGGCASTSAASRRRPCSTPPR